LDFPCQVSSPGYPDSVSPDTTNIYLYYQKSNTFLIDADLQKILEYYGAVLWILLLALF